MFARLKNIGFTGQDIIIISFLLVSFFAGLAIKFSGWDPAPEYSYSKADKEFEQSLKQAFTGIDSKPLSEEQLRRINELNLLNDSLLSSKEIRKQGTKESALHKKINLNTASADELALLPGIGNAMAVLPFRFPVFCGGAFPSRKRTRNRKEQNGWFRWPPGPPAPTGAEGWPYLQDTRRAYIPIPEWKLRRRLFP